MAHRPGDGNKIITFGVTKIKENSIALSKLRKNMQGGVEQESAKLFSGDKTILSKTKIKKQNHQQHIIDLLQNQTNLKDQLLEEK